jgi:hypothetical protein
MRIESLQDQYKEISDLLDLAPQDTNLHIHWGRYVCVLLAGFLENALQEIYTEYARGVSDGNVANYVSSQIGYTVGTPSADNFIRTAGSFSAAWAESLRLFIREDGRGDAINVIRRNRNQITHGGQSTISPAQIVEYLPKCVEVVEFIEDQCFDHEHSND